MIVNAATERFLQEDPHSQVSYSSILKNFSREEGALSKNVN